MPVITAREASNQLYNLINQVCVSDVHEPVIISNGTENAVLISEDEWRSIQETLFLVNIPGMRESIKDGLNTKIEDCSGRIINKNKKT